MAKASRRIRTIRDLPFRHNLKPGLGFELFRVAELFERADRHAIDHSLETPQRPAFSTIYVGVRGHGTLVVDFAPTPLGAGYVTVVARGRVQQFVRDREFDAWMLLFSSEFLAIDPRGVDPLRTASIFDTSWQMPAVRVAAADHRELLALVAQLDAEQARPSDSLQIPVLAALLRTLVLRVERLARRGDRVPPPAALSRFFTILEADHLATRSVAHYARAAGISTRALGELLVAHTGRTTKRVIDERVVLELKRLLAHTDLSVKELATRAGFAEPTNLVKFFRHHVAATPTAFRARFHHPDADPDLAGRRPRV